MALVGADAGHQQRVLGELIVGPKRVSVDAVARVIGKKTWEELDAGERLYISRWCHLRLARAASIDMVESRLVISLAEGRGHVVEGT